MVAANGQPERWRLRRQESVSVGTQPTRECFLEAVRNLDAGGIDGFELVYGPEDNQGSDAVFITVMDAEGQFREVKELAR